MEKKYSSKLSEVLNKGDQILLHSCCAPCSGAIIEKLHIEGIQQTVYFYNPNIHPKEEYEIRKMENKRFCDKMNIQFIDADYDTDTWFKRVKGLEFSPERGERCSVCFDMRFEKTALYAYENGFEKFSSTLGLSRWKNMDQINISGVRSASRYDGITYETYNWRKRGGSDRMYKLAKEENFYKQEYCGCVFSLRDTNAWRIKQGKDKINRGKEFYN